MQYYYYIRNIVAVIIKNPQPYRTKTINAMYNRIFDIDSRLDEGMFLFGARQVGKSTLLKEKFKDAVYFDLLDSDLRKRLQRKPELLKEALDKYPEKTLVIVDEIQKVPDLLDTVHSLMVEKGLYFILSGSSARKLKREERTHLVDAPSQKPCFLL